MHPLEKFRHCPVCGSAHIEESSPKSKRCSNCGFEYFINPAAAVAAFIVNEKGDLLVVRRDREPAKGMLDLPGGFLDMGESVEEALLREVMEETNLKIATKRYLFSEPNVYRFSDMDINTSDMFFLCTAENVGEEKAADDARECMWLKREEVRTELFGLRSVRAALRRFMGEE